jgi:NAD(P)-dependent dehydrogenase (short-subunit alcohol dehydrogenase family)
MLTKSPIQPDEQAIVALQRLTTGADVHETNGVIHTYRLHCAAGNIGGVDEAKRNMYRRARELMQRPSRSQERLARTVRGNVKGSLQMANTAKTAIVTGASRGIGAGLVEAFLKRGYSVVANSRNITKTNTFAAAANVALVDGDIGDPRTAAKIVDTAVSRFGRIDVLINNAGVFIPKPFTEYTTEDFNTLVSTTLAGFLYVSQLAVKQMVRQKSGSIINVSTTLVDQPIAGVGAAVQIMLKGALNAVTRALAIEYAKEGIRVNTIAPGVINTPMHKPETHDFLKGLHPVGRIGEIKEIVDAALFLTDATFTSGEILHVDGGAHAGKW